MRLFLSEVKVKRIGRFGGLIVSLFLFTALAQVSYAHEGHAVDDVVVSDLGELGKVDFDVDCGALSQQAMNTGVGLLHHMMYAQAEKHFEHWLEKDPTCAMFYWGYAMSLFHPLWPDKISQDALSSGEKALRKAQAMIKNGREAQYVDAALKYFDNAGKLPESERVSRWAAAQKQLSQDFPEDMDAVAFYALSELVIAPKTDKTFQPHLRASELLATILKNHPLHPGAIHYSIHAFDNPVLADRGVDVARAYDQIAPDVPHALHMPTHIFVRLGEWRDAIAWNRRSADAALKYPAKGKTSMHYVHALDYLVYAQLQLGRVDEARMAQREIDAHHPLQTTFPAAYALATIPARIALEQQDWQQASQLPSRQPDYFQWDKFPQVEAITHFARGVGAARSENLEGARTSASELDKLYQQVMRVSPDYWAPLVDAQRKSVRAWILYAEGKQGEALKLMQAAADIEDALDKNPVTPGAVLPARELLGDMLVLSGQDSKARMAYQKSLAIGVGRRYSAQAIENIAP